VTGKHVKINQAFFEEALAETGDSLAFGDDA
jgi:hypothetical protein